MSEIKIDIKRSGFPVKVGSVELWFDTSMENLRTFFGVDDILNEKFKDAEEKAKSIHFPKEINDENVQDLDVKTIDAAFDVNKKYIGAQYDVVFGDGTFDKLYKVHPDIAELERIIDPLFVAIAKKIDEMEAERTEFVDKTIEEVLKNKAKKK